MSKHTPGPWKACLNVPNAAIEGHIIKADHGAECPIASLWVGGGTKGKPTQIVNARLIAAAPDLLEACKAQHEAMDRLFALLISKVEGYFPSKSGQPWRAILQGNAAIIKAEEGS